MSGDGAVLAIGGSAGGIEALVELVAALPADLPACVLVSVHIGSNSRSNLPRILTRSGPLPPRTPATASRCVRAASTWHHRISTCSPRAAWPGSATGHG